MRRRIRSGLGRRVGRLRTRVELAVGIRITRAKRAEIQPRFASGRRWYQDQFVDFAIAERAHVLDVGCGPFPFAEATVVCDLFESDTVHRRGELQTNGKRLVVADVTALPFEDDEFDFVYCSHLLEHVEDPITACRELARVGKRGYIETPNFMKDALFCQASEMSHRWHTVVQGTTLFFFEYSERQQQGVRSSAWPEVIWSPFTHPLQRVFSANQDLFNTMLLWEGGFTVVVVRPDGQIVQRDVP